MAGCDTGVAGAFLQEGGNLAYTLRRLLSCNHIRAYEFFTESINSECQFVGVECDSWDAFYNGKCDGYMFDISVLHSFYSPKIGQASTF